MNEEYENNILYSMLNRMANFYEIKINFDLVKIKSELQKFNNEWKRYNPRKPIERYGLSITSLNGDLSGIPDLDSLLEYNKENNIKIDEVDIKIKTPVYDIFQDQLSLFENNLVRSHVIKLCPGGYFPIHRDYRSTNIKSFRLFVPIQNCNPPNHYFILDNNIINFDHGSTYYINTCLPHCLFNASRIDTLFIILNVKLNKQTVDTMFKLMKIT
jgi:hypothetical protein